MDFQAIMTSIVDYLSKFGLNIIAAIIIFIIGKWVAKILSKAAEKMLIKSKVDVTLAKFTRQLTYFALLILIVIAALAKLGFPTTQFTVAIGAAGLAIAFALQGSLANFAAGIFLIVFKPFKVGDFIEIAGKVGIVEEIQMLTTVINTPDNTKVVVPNGKITSDNILNFTVNGNRRVDLAIGVSYGDDIKKAKDVMIDVLKSDQRILSDPEPQVAVSELADSSVNFVVRPWCKAADYWAVYFDTTENVKNALDDNGISIPFPQTDVHLINA